MEARVLDLRDGAGDIAPGRRARLARVGAEGPKSLALPAASASASLPLSARAIAASRDNARVEVVEIRPHERSDGCTCG